VLHEDPEEFRPGLVGLAEAPVISPTSGCSRRRHSPSFTMTLSPGWGTGLISERVGSGTADLEDESRVVRRDEIVAPLPPQVADNLVRPRLRIWTTRPTRSPGALAGDAAVDADGDGVARQGDTRVVWGDLDRGLVAFFHRRSRTRNRRL